MADTPDRSNLGPVTPAPGTPEHKEHLHHDHEHRDPLTGTPGGTLKQGWAMVRRLRSCCPRPRPAFEPQVVEQPRAALQGLGFELQIPSPPGMQSRLNLPD
jgi:hypothetical protein